MNIPKFKTLESCFIGSSRKSATLHPQGMLPFSFAFSSPCSLLLLPCWCSDALRLTGQVCSSIFPFFGRLLSSCSLIGSVCPSSTVFFFSLTLLMSDPKFRFSLSPVFFPLSSVCATDCLCECECVTDWLCIVLFLNCSLLLCVYANTWLTTCCLSSLCLWEDCFFVSKLILSSCVCFRILSRYITGL